MKAACSCEKCAALAERELQAQVLRREREQRRALRQRFLADLRREHPSGDPYIASAIHLLGELLPDQPHAVPDTRNIRFGDTLASDGAFACVDRYRKIWLDTTGPAYQAAKLGYPLPLSAVLLHEQYHVLYGADEVGAYEVTLDLLDRADAPMELRAFVEQARAYALRDEGADDTT